MTNCFLLKDLNQFNNKMRGFIIVDKMQEIY